MAYDRIPYIDIAKSTQTLKIADFTIWAPEVINHPKLAKSRVEVVVWRKTKRIQEPKKIN